MPAPRCRTGAARARRTWGCALGDTACATLAAPPAGCPQPVCSPTFCSASPARSLTWLAAPRLSSATLDVPSLAVDPADSTAWWARFAQAVREVHGSLLDLLSHGLQLLTEPVLRIDDTRSATAEAAAPTGSATVETAFTVAEAVRAVPDRIRKVNLLGRYQCLPI
ncbi:MAG: hypothetical protein ACRDTC_03385 [Pseudonocardiaceae bacterium]